VLAAGITMLTLSLTTGTTPVAAQSGRNGVIHVEKDCKEYDGSAGGHCTIAASNLGQIPATSPVYYDQAARVPTGMLDSNLSAVYRLVIIGASAITAYAVADAEIHCS